MASSVTFKILEDIAKDLSGSEISFPTFLDITFQVRTALKDPNLNVEQLAQLVGAEPLMSTKIIRMSNSVALNSSGREIADVKSAIVRVGMEAVRTVSFAVAMEQLLKSKQMHVFENISKKLWEHTSHVAALCRVLARKIAKINGDEAMFAGLVHDLGVFYLMSRAANFPELVNDKAELHALLVGWHDSIGHALLSALGSPESILVAVQEHETDREITELKTLSDVLYVANKIANRSASWRDPELDAAVDTSMLDTFFDAETLAEIIEESEEEVQSLKMALGG
ncbi:HDOD domain-containing protein [Dechloromonas denitrificans]|uniref:HDOD domain-containing protein n=1 Tax=Azonexaceae TaxID=2008795 RepID=UPI001CF866A8|nr:HDOD domain-containing protein [Dechloromonas denitrificans]UCV03089.1 HDOD domain-containing protein [Dechloromonas denitrificans]UCV07415.1 HDOD domain-containing protein [Dechloromonas denitrificans]